MLFDGCKVDVYWHFGQYHLGHRVSEKQTALYQKILKLE